MESKINVCLVGIGDVASALVQGIENYKKNPENAIGILPLSKNTKSPILILYWELMLMLIKSEKT